MSAVSDSLIQKPPPLAAKLDEEYRAELKEWMGEWYPDESKAPSEPSPSMLGKTFCSAVKYF